MSGLSYGAAPGDLIPGDPVELRWLSARLTGLANELADTASRLQAIDAGRWEGSAAVAFQGVLAEQPRRYLAAANSFGAASSAVASYAAALETAQADAAGAVSSFAAAEATSAAWRQRRATALGLTEADDPGDEGRSRANSVLAAAREEVDFAAARVVAALEAAAASAPTRTTLPDGLLNPNFVDLRYPAGLFGRAGQQSAFLTEAEFQLVAHPPTLDDGHGSAPHHFFKGVYAALKDPAVEIYRLTPVSGGWTSHWSDLGKGLAYGVTHPVEFGEEMIDLQALHDQGFAYWLGNIAPAAAATVLSGGAAGALRSAGAADRVVAGLSETDRLVAGDTALATSARLAGSFKGEHNWTHDVMHPGPLTSHEASVAALRRSAAQTFATGKYDVVSSESSYVLFKAGDSPGGRFFTLQPPVSEAQVRIDAAVKPHWTTPQGAYTGSSQIEKGYAFVVQHPEHPVAIGPVGSQGGVYLGGPGKLQVFVDDRSALGLRQVGEWSLHDPPDWVRQLMEDGR